MAIGLEDKKAIVADVNETASNALSLVVADARGVTAGAMDSLRKQARESGVSLRVVRNTLAKRAMQGTEFECVKASYFGASSWSVGFCHDCTCNQTGKLSLT